MNSERQTAINQRKRKKGVLDLYETKEPVGLEDGLLHGEGFVIS
jgi:hypothetical protein